MVFSDEYNRKGRVHSGYDGTAKRREERRKGRVIPVDTLGKFIPLFIPYVCVIYCSYVAINAIQVERLRKEGKKVSHLIMKFVEGYLVFPALVVVVVIVVALAVRSYTLRKACGLRRPRHKKIAELHSESIQHLTDSQPTIQLVVLGRKTSRRVERGSGSFQDR